MARSVSRSRKTASKSPARTRRQVTPKSEPLKKAASKSLSRSRSASRGRKTSKKQSSKKSSRSKSYSRELDALLKEPGEKSTPPRTVRKTSSPTKRAEPKRAYSSSKSSSTKSYSSRTPSIKSSASKTSREPDTVKTLTIERTSRPVERKVYTSSSMEPEFRQRYYRQESSSRSPPQVRVMKKRPTSLYSKLCDGVYGPVRSVGKQIRGRTRAAWNAIASNRYEIFVTLFLLLFVYLLSYFIMYTDPARTRKFIHSLPGNVYTWVTKLFFHKQK